MEPAPKTELESLCDEMESLSKTIGRTERLCPNQDIGEVRKHAAGAIANRIMRMHSYTAADNDYFLATLEEHNDAFGDVMESIVTAGNTRILAPAALAAKGPKRRRKDNKEDPQRMHPRSVLSMLTQNDWAAIQNPKFSDTFKLAVIQMRLNRYGFKHVQEQSRVGPIAILISQHYGIKSVGTADCSYKHLYDKQRDFAESVKRGAIAVPDPDGYRLEFPEEASSLPEELLHFACPDDDDPRVVMELADFSRCCEHVPLRDNNAKLTQEKKRGVVAAGLATADPSQSPSPQLARQNTVPVYSQDDLMRMIADDRANRPVHHNASHGTWEVAPENRHKALTLPGWEPRGTGTVPATTAIVEFDKGIRKPIVRSFGTLTSAKTVEDSTAGGQDASDDKHKRTRDSADDDWDSWDGQQWSDAKSDDASRWSKSGDWEEEPRRPRVVAVAPWRQPRSAEGAEEVHEERGVAYYERETQKALERAKETRAKAKAAADAAGAKAGGAIPARGRGAGRGVGSPAAGAGRGAGRGAASPAAATPVSKKGAAKAAAKSGGKPDKPVEKPRKFVKVQVDISSIKNQASLDSKSIDGYKRAGYDLGLRQAKSKGLSGTCWLSKDFGKLGYKLAADYLVSKGY